MKVIMPPTTPYAGKFSSCSVYNNNNHHPQPQSPYHSNTAPKPSREHIHNGVYPAAENPYDVPQPHHSYRSSSLSSMTSKEHHYSSSCVVSENPYSPQHQPHSPRQHSTSCPGRAHRHSSHGEHSCRNNSASVKSRLYGQGITASYGEMCYHDNSLVSASLEALIQHLVPTVDYYPDVSVCQPNVFVVLSVLKSNSVQWKFFFLFTHQRSYVFTFLLSSRLFLHPYELMTRVCHLCVEQQRSGDVLLDKVGYSHKHTGASLPLSHPQQQDQLVHM